MENLVKWFVGFLAVIFAKNQLFTGARAGGGGSM
jgi:hypothetical protein